MILIFTYNGKCCELDLPQIDRGDFVQGQDMFELIEDSAVFTQDEINEIAQLNDETFMGSLKEKK